MEKTWVKPHGHSITEVAQTVDKGQKRLPRKHFLHTVASVLILTEDPDNTVKRQKLAKNPNTLRCYTSRVSSWCSPLDMPSCCLLV